MFNGVPSKYHISVAGAVTHISGPELRKEPYISNDPNIIMFPNGPWNGFSYAIYGVDPILEEQTLNLTDYASGVLGKYSSEGANTYVVGLASLACIGTIDTTQYDIFFKGLSITAVGTPAPLYIEMIPYSTNHR